MAAKTRYRQSDAPCRVVAAEGDALKLSFAEPQCR
jgi:tRNA-specific 2-thiouridylase